MRLQSGEEMKYPVKVISRSEISRLYEIHKLWDQMVIH